MLHCDFQRRTKSTRKRNTPQNAGNRPFPEFRVFGCVAFSGALCSPLNGGAKTHPKTQNTRKRRFWKRSITCVFGCVAFSGALWRLPRFKTLKLRVRWKVGSDLRFRAAISEPETPFILWDFCRVCLVNAEIASDCDCAILVR